MFQDFAARELVAPRRDAAALCADDAATLIGRYPNVSEIELARLINLSSAVFRAGGGVTELDKRTRSKLNDFRAGHRSKIRPPLSHHAALLAIAVGGIFLAAWAVTFFG